MATQEVVRHVSPRFVTRLAELWPPQGEWTENAYFSLPDTNRIIELSEGELIMPPHPTDTHQRVVGNFYRVLYDYVTEHDLGIVRFAPLPVRLWQGKVREPDVLFVSHAHADRIGEQFYGPPDLVMEAVSPGTQSVDRGEKFVEYARAGIAEYWLVDSEVQTIEVFVLRDQAFTLLVEAGAGEQAYSELLAGSVLSADDVFMA